MNKKHERHYSIRTQFTYLKDYLAAAAAVVQANGEYGERTPELLARTLGMEMHDIWYDERMEDFKAALWNRRAQKRDMGALVEMGQGSVALSRVITGLKSYVPSMTERIYDNITLAHHFIDLFEHTPSGPENMTP